MGSVGVGSGTGKVGIGKLGSGGLGKSAGDVERDDVGETVGVGVGDALRADVGEAEDESITGDGETSGGGRAGATSAATRQMMIAEASRITTLPRSSQAPTSLTLDRLTHVGQQ